MSERDDTAPQAQVDNGDCINVAVVQLDAMEASMQSAVDEAKAALAKVVASHQLIRQHAGRVRAQLIQAANNRKTK